LVTFKKIYLAAVTNSKVSDPVERSGRDRALGQGIQFVKYSQRPQQLIKCQSALTNTAANKHVNHLWQTS